jgi:predicted DNA-binding transcriptional regulator YafY
MDVSDFPYAEIIADAARNLRCVKLTYKDEVRTVEPYSYRISPTGSGTLFYGFHREDNQIKAFLLDKIQSVEPSDEPYSPRWAVEIA